MHVTIGVTERRDRAAADILIDADRLAGTVVDKIKFRQTHDDPLAVPHFESDLAGATYDLLDRNAVDAFGKDTDAAHADSIDRRLRPKNASCDVISCALMDVFYFVPLLDGGGRDWRDHHRERPGRPRALIRYSPSVLLEDGGVDQLLPAVAWLTASLQGSLTSERWDFMHASIRPPPGFTSAQTFLTSALHALEIAAAFTRTA